ncbi:MAG: hypothetical protein M3Q58_12665 [Bacteroidota bacterium]|nr:hypothetical protein [Bacteroidota bacterium]
MLIKIISIFFFLFIFCFPVKSQDLFNLENSILFADFLKRTKQYESAAREYERIIFLDPKNDSIKLSLIRVYFLSGEYTLALKKASQIYPLDFEQPRQFAIEYSRLLLLNDSSVLLNNLIRNNQNILPEDVKRMKLYSHMGNANWQEAEKIISESPEDYAEHSVVIKQALNQKNKSPFIATGLSVVIPGAGKIYTRDWKDGLFSFLVVGSMAFQSYRGFAKYGTEGSSGWIYGSIGAVFYGGNLYGTHKAAKRYNSKLKESVKAKTEHLLITNY